MPLTLPMTSHSPSPGTGSHSIRPNTSPSPSPSSGLSTSLSKSLSQSSSPAASHTQVESRPPDGVVARGRVAGGGRGNSLTDGCNAIQTRARWKGKGVKKKNDLDKSQTRSLNEKNNSSLRSLSSLARNRMVGEAQTRTTQRSVEVSIWVMTTPRKKQTRSKKKRKISL